MHTLTFAEQTHGCFHGLHHGRSIIQTNAFSYKCNHGPSLICTHKCTDAGALTRRHGINLCKHADNYGQRLENKVIWIHVRIFQACLKALMHSFAARLHSCRFVRTNAFTHTQASTRRILHTCAWTRTSTHKRELFRFVIRMRTCAQICLRVRFHALTCQRMYEYLLEYPLPCWHEFDAHVPWRRSPRA
jgi:hypothetical protein